MMKKGTQNHFYFYHSEAQQISQNYQREIEKEKRKRAKIYEIKSHI